MANMYIYFVFVLWKLKTNQLPWTIPAKSALKLCVYKQKALHWVNLKPEALNCFKIYNKNTTSNG